jgi:hypothetical protein
MKAALFSFVFTISNLCILQAQAPYQPYRTEKDITLDGVVDEAEWLLTPVETDFMQEGPDPGAAPTERTEVRIIYNDTYLFVAITSFDSEPDKMIRLEMERDFPLGQDDGTAFIIDPYHNKITGLNFVANTLDARWDAQVTQDGGGLNDSYNTFWEARTYVGDFGYSTEYRIPFSSLRFEQKEEVLMGFRIARLIKRKNELITFPKCDPNTENTWTNISYAREIVFRDLKSRNPLYISPYIIANYYEENVLNAEGTAYEKNSNFMTRKHFFENETLDKIVSNIGVDAKYGLSKNLTLDLTINTDFAQAEVDDRIINLSKYEVNLPEKRSFFLESANQLSFGFPSGNELFITRRIGNENGVIVPIIGGVRLTGKVNDWQIGALNMQTKGVTSAGISPHNFTVLRTRRDIDSLGSFVGAIVCNRVNTDTSALSNQSFGIDFVKRLNQQFTIEGGLINTLDNFEAPDLLESLYFHAGFFQSATKGFIYNATSDLVGQHLNPVMGYLDDNDYGSVKGTLKYQWNLKNSKLLNYFYISTFNKYRWKIENGGAETIADDLYTGINFKSGAAIDISIIEFKQDSLFFDWELDDRNAISAGVYQTFNTAITLVSPQQSNYTASIYTTYGGFYGGERLYVQPDITYWVNKHFNLSLTYEYNHITFEKYLDEEKNTLFESNLIRLGLVYNFTTRYSLKTYFQFDDLSQQTSTNIRFRYNPKEGTDLFIVINQGINNYRTRLDPKLPYINNQAFTVKFTKTFGGD